MTSMTGFIAQPLPWQQAQWQRLQQQIEAGRLPQALLLAGPQAVGKRTFARALAALLLCRSPQYGGACGTCKSCHLVAAEAHPDGYWLAPEESGGTLSGTAKGAGVSKGGKTIKVDRVRELVERMAQTAQQGGRKVAVIAPAEAMNRNAANALLKTLEEPPGATLLILVSDVPGRLLPTIRSRCQRLDFPVPARAAVAAWLQPQAAPEKAEQALIEAEGRPLLARELLTGDDAARRAQWDEELVAVLERRLSAITAAERWKQGDWSGLLQWLESRLVRALRAQYAAPPAANPAVARLMALPAASLFALLDGLHALINQTVAGANPNPQLALESVLFDVCDAINKNKG